MEIEKFEYLQNKKSFLDEIKNIFDSFLGAIIWFFQKKFDQKQWTQALNIYFCTTGEGDSWTFLHTYKMDDPPETG